jgi:hypothetical protein
VADEEAWAAAIDLLNESRLLRGSPPIADVLERIEHSTVNSLFGGIWIRTSSRAVSQSRRTSQSKS